MGIVIKLIGALGIIGGILFLVSSGSIIGGLTNSSPYSNFVIFLFGFGIIVPSVFIFGFGEIIETLQDCRNELRAIKAGICYQSASDDQHAAIEPAINSQGNQPDKPVLRKLWVHMLKGQGYKHIE